MTVKNKERVVGGGVNITFRLSSPSPLLLPVVSISKSNMTGCINDLELLKS